MVDGVFCAGADLKVGFKYAKFVAETIIGTRYYDSRGGFGICSDTTKYFFGVGGKY